MSQVDGILEQAKSMIPETFTAILAREVARLRGALEVAQAQVTTYSEEIRLSRESEGETMRDLLETREKLESAQAELTTATTEIAERNDTIDALRNDIAELRARLL